MTSSSQGDCYDLVQGGCLLWVFNVGINFGIKHFLWARKSKYKLYGMLSWIW